MSEELKAPPRMQFLLTMVETEIARCGEHESFMVRAGLLRDILEFAIAATPNNDLPTGNDGGRP